MERGLSLPQERWQPQRGAGRWGREGEEQEGKSVTLSPTLPEPAGKMCPSGLPFIFLSFLYDLNTLKYNTSS